MENLTENNQGNELANNAIIELSLPTVSEASKTMSLADPVFIITAIVGAIMAVVARLDMFRQYPEEIPKNTEHKTDRIAVIASIALDAHIGGSVAVLMMVLIAMFEPLGLQPTYLLAYASGFVGVAAVPVFRTLIIILTEGIRWVRDNTVSKFNNGKTVKKK
jgi:hypothetical protein